MEWAFAHSVAHAETAPVLAARRAQREKMANQGIQAAYGTQD